MKFTAIDFETANTNRGSVCAVGLVMVDNGQVVGRLSQLIRPDPLLFDPFNVSIHGISAKDVVDAPTFAEYWPSLWAHVSGPLVAHNAAFDMSVLRHALDHAGRPYPETDYYCTWVISKLVWPQHPTYSLDHIAQAIGITFKHHDAEEDARACALIALAACRQVSVPSLHDLHETFGLRVGRMSSTGYWPCGGAYAPRSNTDHRRKLSAADIIPAGTAPSAGSPCCDMDFVLVRPPTMRELRAKEKKAKLQRQEERRREAEQESQNIQEREKALRSILEHTLSVDDRLDFNALREHVPFTPPPIPEELKHPRPEPDPKSYVARVKPQTLLEHIMNNPSRYERDMKAAYADANQALIDWQHSENERKAKLKHLGEKSEALRMAYIEKRQQKEKAVDAFVAAYRVGDRDAVINYNSMVLEQSAYPNGFPQEFRIDYNPASKELAIHYGLPEEGIVPKEKGYRYRERKDEIEAIPKKPSEAKELYMDIVASVTLRTIHEALEADQGNHIQSVIFNGYVQTIDKATGRDVNPCIVSVMTTREKFMGLNLARIDKLQCLRSLGAKISVLKPGISSVIDIRPAE